MKLKNSYCDETQLKLQANSKTQILIKHNNKLNKTQQNNKTQKVNKLKNSNCDKTQKHKL